MGRKGRRWRKKRRSGSCGCQGLGSDQGLILLRKWMKTNGFHGCLLEPANFEDTGRGLKATRRIEKDATVISIPRGLLITTTTVLKSKIGRHIKRYRPRLLPVEVISIFLIWERSKASSSFWFPYMASLPTHYTNAAYWTEEELAWFPEHVREKGRTQIKRVCDAFNNIELFCSSLGNEFRDLKLGLSIESVRWAWSTINTRSVYMKQAPNPHLSHKEEDHYALAPFLDLLNHSDSAEISASYNQRKQQYEINTLTPRGRHSQVFINYGPHDNQKLLLEYGFLVPDNQHNTIVFYLDDLLQLSKYFQISSTQKRMSIIMDNELHKSLTFSSEGASWSVLTALRILCLTNEAINNWQSVLTGTPLADGQELKVTRMINYLLLTALRNLPNREHEEATTDVMKMAKLLCDQHKQIIANVNRNLLDDINIL